MRVVLDTNVLVAAFISQGSCHELFEHCFLNHKVILSEPIVQEFAEVLQKKFGYSASEVDATVEIVKSRADLVEPVSLSQTVCRDPDDDMILATALAGNCSVIVTGDKDLLVIGSFGNVQIVAPAEYWDHQK